MPNQFGGSITAIVEKKYKRSLKEVMQSFVDSGMTSKSIADLLGFKVNTIKKYANKLDISLIENAIQKDKYSGFWDDFRKNEINEYNVLSKCWF